MGSYMLINILFYYFYNIYTYIGSFDLRGCLISDFLFCFFFFSSIGRKKPVSLLFASLNCKTHIPYYHGLWYDICPYSLADLAQHANAVARFSIDYCDWAVV